MIDSVVKRPPTGSRVEADRIFTHPETEKAKSYIAPRSRVLHVLGAPFNTVLLRPPKLLEFPKQGGYPAAPPRIANYVAARYDEYHVNGLILLPETGYYHNIPCENPGVEAIFQAIVFPFMAVHLIDCSRRRYRLGFWYDQTDHLIFYERWKEKDYRFGASGIPTPQRPL